MIDCATLEPDRDPMSDDRILQLSGIVPEREMRDRFLDRMDIERYEKGFGIGCDWSGRR